MADHYSHLSRAQLAYEYLHTNSTTHEFLFGALAELIDNSRDANATTTKIYTVPHETVRGGVLLNFLDDGCGMDPVEVSQVIQFGRSMKRQTGSDQIGQYGNGLKSGSMRIGKDMILFTKKAGFLSCLFLSRTFHEREDIHEVIVPLPSWSASNKKANVKSKEDQLKHDIEISIISKHSPFKSEAEMLLQFDNITSDTGTLIIIFNLKLMDNGDPELDVLTDPDDIKMADPHSDEIYDIDENILPEKVSFRAYTTVLYSEPRMKIYIQHKKVRTRRLMNCLLKPRQYLYASTRFKKRSEQEVDYAEQAAKMAEEHAKELATQAKEAMARGDYTSRDSRSETQMAANKAQEAKMNAEVKRRIATEKRKSLKEPKQLTFTFGFNVESRACDGMFIYNCNRLIRMYEKVGPQQEGGVKCAGLIGVVDVPYLVLEPTHNKQDFADAKEYKHLLKSMADHMLQYWKDCKIEGQGQGVVRFWEDFGYLGRWKDGPSDEPKYVMKRALSVPMLVQCDICLKWRQLQFSRRNPSMEVPEDWVCAMNTDPSFQSCNKPEQKFNIPVGKMMKEIKNVQEKAAEDAAKYRERLEKAEKKLNKSSGYDRASQSPTVSDSYRSRQKEPVRSPSPPPRIKPSRREPPKKEPPRKEPPKKEPPRREPPRKEPPKKEPPKKEPPKREPPKKEPPKKEPPKKEPPRKEPPKKETPTREPTTTKKATPSVPAVKRKYLEDTPEKDENEKPSKRKSTEPGEISSPAKKAKEVATTKDAEKKSTSKTDNRKQKEDVSSTTKPKQLENDEKKGSADDESSISAIYQIGSRVESKVHDRWYSGRVNAIKSGTSSIPVKVKVKFDQHSQDKFDKWFEETDPNLRLIEDANSTTPLNSKLSVSLPSPVSPRNIESPSTTTNELQNSGITSPITTTAPADSMFANLQDEYSKQQEILDGLASKFRSCLHFFCPPDFHLNKEAIMQMKPNDLREFPVSKFIKDYERNIKQHVRQHELRAKEAEMRCTNITKDKDSQVDKVKSLEKELAKEKEVLQRLRADVSVMVRNLLQGGAQLDPDDNSDQVDSYLHAIVSEISEQS